MRIFGMIGFLSLTLAACDEAETDRGLSLLDEATQQSMALSVSDVPLDPDTLRLTLTPGLEPINP